MELAFCLFEEGVYVCVRACVCTACTSNSENPAFSGNQTGFSPPEHGAESRSLSCVLTGGAETSRLWLRHGQLSPDQMSHTQIEPATSAELG